MAKRQSFCWYGQIGAGDMMGVADVTSEYIDENFFSIPLPITREGTSRSAAPIPISTR